MYPHLLGPKDNNYLAWAKEMWIEFIQSGESLPDRLFPHSNIYISSMKMFSYQNAVYSVNVSYSE